MITEMKLWKMITHLCRRGRVVTDFEKVCSSILDGYPFKEQVSVSVDNDLYATFGMSAEEISAQVSTQTTELRNQKHR